MRVFADTNFLVSAFATRGLSAEVFTLIITDHELVVGEVVIRELKRVLADKFKLPASYILEVEEIIRGFEIAPPPEKISEIQLRDEDDRWVLGSAIECGANVLLTGDKDLLEVAERVHEIKIVSPRGFWDLLRS